MGTPLSGVCLFLEFDLFEKLFSKCLEAVEEQFDHLDLQFLGIPVPEAPFPNVNDTAMFQKRTK